MCNHFTQDIQINICPVTKTNRTFSDLDFAESGTVKLSQITFRFNRIDIDAEIIFLPGQPNDEPFDLGLISTQVGIVAVADDSLFAAALENTFPHTAVPIW